MNPKKSFGELKRRNVYKIAVAYAVVAWLLIQVATQVFPFFEIPGWAVRLVVLLLILGFPIALILAWAFEITPEGIKRAEDVAPDESITRRTGRKLDFLIIGILLVVIGVFAYQRFGPQRKTPAIAPELPEKSIAVLPFENLSRDPDNAFFTDGVQDEILADLAKVADLKVISRTSVMLYKSGNPRNLREIGQQLGVVHVLEGSVQRSANRVRVMAQLIDARTDAHLWAQTYDRDLADVFAIQSEIAKTIADQLQAKLSPEEKAALKEQATTDLAAYDLYTRAKTLIENSVFNAPQNESLYEAVKLLNEAIRRDPAFALAYYQLAHAHDLLYFVGADHTPARLAVADAAIQSLVRLRPDSGEAHLALAKHLYFGHLDYGRARVELDLAKKSLPNDPLLLLLAGYIDRRQSRWDESTKNLERALELDPQNPQNPARAGVLQQLAKSYECLRRYADAERTLDRAIALAPKDAATRATRAEIELHWHADPRSFISMIQTILAENPREAENIAEQWLPVSLCQRDVGAAQRALAALPMDGCHVETIPFPRSWCEGLVAQIRGDKGAARAAFTDARNEAAKLVREQPAYAAAFLRARDG